PHQAPLLLRAHVDQPDRHRARRPRPVGMANTARARGAGWAPVRRRDTTGPSTTGRDGAPGTLGALNLDISGYAVLLNSATSSYTVVMTTPRSVRFDESVRHRLDRYVRAHPGTSASS